MKNKTILAVGAIGAFSVISLIAMSSSRQDVVTKTGPGFLQRTETSVSKQYKNGNEVEKKTVKKHVKKNPEQLKKERELKRQRKQNQKVACPCNRPTTPKNSAADVVACGCKPKTNVNSIIACPCKPKTNVNNVIACGCKPKQALVS